MLFLETEIFPHQDYLDFPLEHEKRPAAEFFDSATGPLSSAAGGLALRDYGPGNVWTKIPTS